MSWLSGYLAVINFTTWIAYGLDKGGQKKENGGSRRGIS